MMRWLFSKTVRDAGAMQKHVYRLLCAQRDLISSAAFQLVSGALIDLRKALHDRESVGKIREKMWACEEVANKWLKPYPHAIWRENVEVLLVAIAVAMAIRTFFLQPYKIPTGSMQPTLYGVNSEPDFLPMWEATRYGAKEINTALLKVSAEEKKLVIPTGMARFMAWLHGTNYIHIVAQNDGAITQVGPMSKLLIFNIKQSFWIGDPNDPSSPGQKYTIWFPPDFGEPDGNFDPLTFRAGLIRGRSFHKGDDVVRIEVTAGDHLFVDRLSYNFRKPTRGDIIVFETEGIPEDQRNLQNPPIPADEFYIKRLCGLGGETIRLQQDYTVTGVPEFNGGDIPVGHLVVDGKELSTATPHFENLYSFDNPTNGTKTIPYHGDGYYGHAMIERLQAGQKVPIPPDHLFVMGDNTMDSLDSRFWGDFPASYVVGKSFFVYWPLSSRFGWGNQ